MNFIALIAECRVVAQNGQPDDVKDIAVAPGTGIDLEFDSDRKCLLSQ